MMSFPRRCVGLATGWSVFLCCAIEVSQHDLDLRSAATALAQTAERGARASIEEATAIAEQLSAQRVDPMTVAIQRAESAHLALMRTTRDGRGIVLREVLFHRRGLPSFAALHELETGPASPRRKAS